MNKNLYKTGPLGVIIATLGCPAYFPVLAGLASAMGLTFLQGHEGFALKF